MRGLPKDLQIRSEELEPTICHLIGKWYAQSQWMKKTYGPHSAAYVDSLNNWWYGMESLSRLMITCRDATHASLGVSNHMQRVKRMIEEELGIKFSFMDKNLNFRQLVTFELEFPEFKEATS
jgi:hypothetical protein